MVMQTPPIHERHSPESAHSYDGRDNYEAAQAQASSSPPPLTRIRKRSRTHGHRHHANRPAHRYSSSPPPRSPSPRQSSHRHSHREDRYRSARWHHQEDDRVDSRGSLSEPEYERGYGQGVIRPTVRRSAVYIDEVGHDPRYHRADHPPSAQDVQNPHHDQQQQQQQQEHQQQQQQQQQQHPSTVKPEYHGAFPPVPVQVVFTPHVIGPMSPTYKPSCPNPIGINPMAPHQPRRINTGQGLIDNLRGIPKEYREKMKAEIIGETKEKSLSNSVKKFLQQELIPQKQQETIVPLPPAFIPYTPNPTPLPLPPPPPPSLPPPPSQLPRHAPHSRYDSMAGRGGQQKQLWQFLFELLTAEQKFTDIISWTGERRGEFKLLNPDEVSRLWGLCKNKREMNYDKMSRAIRYYYEKGVMEKVQGQRYCYCFTETVLKNLACFNPGAMTPFPKRQQERINGEDIVIRNYMTVNGEKLPVDMLRHDGGPPSSPSLAASDERSYSSTHHNDGSNSESPSVLSGGCERASSPEQLYGRHRLSRRSSQSERRSSVHPYHANAMRRSPNGEIASNAHIVTPKPITPQVITYSSQVTGSVNATGLPSNSRIIYASPVVRHGMAGQQKIVSSPSGPVALTPAFQNGHVTVPTSATSQSVPTVFVYRRESV